jgi:hypothetical protein
MDWEFERVGDGNSALTGDMDISQIREFTLGLAFGNSEHRAFASLMQSLAITFDGQLSRYRTHCS